MQQELGPMRSSRRGGRADGRSTVMALMYAKARPTTTSCSAGMRRRGAARAARAVERLRLLRDVRALAGWSPGVEAVSPPTAVGGCCRPPRGPAGSVAAGRPGRARGGSAWGTTTRIPAASSISGFIDELSTWLPAAEPEALLAPGRSGRPRRGVRHAPPGPGQAWPRAAPAAPVRLPRRCTRNLWSPSGSRRPDSVHLTRWPAAELAVVSRPGGRDATGRAQRAVDLAARLRSQAGLRTRQPLGPPAGSRFPGGPIPNLDALLRGDRGPRSNVKDVVRDR